MAETIKKIPGELKLGGILRSYDSFDLNYSVSIDQDEAYVTPDSVLINVLHDAVYKEAKPNSNGHHEFFDGLPPDRIARLFIKGTQYVAKKIPSCYLFYLSKKDNVDKVYEIVFEFLRHKNWSIEVSTTEEITISGENLADQFLLSGAITADRFDWLLSLLYMDYPDYATSRTTVDYSRFSVASKQAAEMDADGNKLISGSDLAAANDAKPDNVLMVLSAGSLSTLRNRVAVQYVLRELPPSTVAQILSGIMLAPSVLDKLSGASDIGEAPSFVNSLILVNPDFLASGLYDLEARTPQIYDMAGAVIAESLDEGAGARWLEILLAIREKEKGEEKESGADGGTDEAPVEKKNEKTSYKGIVGKDI